MPGLWDARPNQMQFISRTKSRTVGGCFLRALASLGREDCDGHVDAIDQRAVPQPNSRTSLSRVSPSTLSSDFRSIQSA
jgi:hypothetical protein